MFFEETAYDYLRSWRNNFLIPAKSNRFLQARNNSLSAGIFLKLIICSFGHPESYEEFRERMDILIKYLEEKNFIDIVKYHSMARRLPMYSNPVGVSLKSVFLLFPANQGRSEFATAGIIDDGYEGYY